MAIEPSNLPKMRYILAFPAGSADALRFTSPFCDGKIHPAAPAISRHHLHLLERFMKKYQCIVCGWIYDEAEGWPQDGIKAGTKWEDIPDDWTCPDCGVSKADFEMVEV